MRDLAEDRFQDQTRCSRPLETSGGLLDSLMNCAKQKISSRYTTVENPGDLSLSERLIALL